MTKEFRAPRALKVATVICAVIFQVVAAIFFQTRGTSALTIAAVGLALFGIVAVLAVWLDRVALLDETLVVVSNFRRRIYARNSIVKVSWAKGCPVMMQLENGQWTKLPPVGSGNQSVGMTIRAWIKPRNRPT